MILLGVALLQKQRAVVVEEEDRKGAVQDAVEVRLELLAYAQLFILLIDQDHVVSQRIVFLRQNGSIVLIKFRLGMPSGLIERRALRFTGESPTRFYYEIVSCRTDWFNVEGSITVIIEMTGDGH